MLGFPATIGFTSVAKLIEFEIIPQSGFFIPPIVLNNSSLAVMNYAPF